MSDIDVMLAVLKVTKFENRFYNFDEDPYDPNRSRNIREKTYSDHNPELVKLLAENGYGPSIYVCISPKITVQRIDYPKGYKHKDLDMRALRMGNPACIHRYLPLYWETGGGGLDSGTPHRYKLCMHCGHSPSKFNWLRNLFRI